MQIEACAAVHVLCPSANFSATTRLYDQSLWFKYRHYYTPYPFGCLGV